MLVPKGKLPIAGAVLVSPFTKKGRDWLLGGFLVGTRITSKSEREKIPFIVEMTEFKM